MEFWSSDANRVMYEILVFLRAMMIMYSEANRANTRNFGLSDANRFNAWNFGISLYNRVNVWNLGLTEGNGDNVI